jgi:hypothetical protein
MPAIITPRLRLDPRDFTCGPIKCTCRQAAHEAASSIDIDRFAGSLARRAGEGQGKRR